MDLMESSVVCRIVVLFVILTMGCDCDNREPELPTDICVCGSGWTGEFRETRCNMTKSNRAVGLVSADAASIDVVRLGREVHNVGSCEEKGCVNGGCTNVTGVAVCICNTGFTGGLCDIDLCDIRGCDRGRCFISNGAAICSCNFAYTGTLCDINKCEQRECVTDNSYCTLEKGEPVCNCYPGYIGSRCEIDVCSLRDCENGKCERVTDKCICYYGWTGEFCETPLCDTIECINGHCKVRYNKPKCHCDKGWTGDLCEIDINECSSHHPCGFGKCINSCGGFECVCPLGVRGEQCEHLQLESEFFLSALVAALIRFL